MEVDFDGGYGQKLLLLRFILLKLLGFWVSFSDDVSGVLHEIVGYCVFVRCACFAKLCTFTIRTDFYRLDLNLEFNFLGNWKIC